MNEKARLVNGNSQIWYEVLRLKQAGEMPKEIYDIIWTEKELADENMVELIINLAKKNDQLVKKYSEVKMELIALKEKPEIVEEKV